MASSATTEKEQPRVSHQVPNYSVEDVRKAIPRKCFERNTALGLYYVARDLALISATFAIFYNFVTPETIPSTGARYALWGLYTFLQGLFGTGLWIMAHECGHRAFSPSENICDLVGFVCHSVLLVPYFSWQISHRKHHAATNNVDKDMAHVPEIVRSDPGIEGASDYHYRDHDHDLIADAPLAVLLQVLVQQLFGWPIYLLFNFTGHNNHVARSAKRGEGKQNGVFGGVNHFDPSSPVFDAKDAPLVLLSDVGIIATLSALACVELTYGWSNLMIWYIAPWMWVNSHIVALTWLHHTDTSIPHYPDSSWTFQRGASSTIDRDFGFIGRHLFHGIIETHVVHHHFPRIPFYHAFEATDAIKPVLGANYRSDTKDGAWGFVSAMWRTAMQCRRVRPALSAEGIPILLFEGAKGS